MATTAPICSLPGPIAVAIALSEPIGAALAVRCTGHAFDLEFHQPLRHEPIIGTAA